MVSPAKIIVTLEKRYTDEVNFNGGTIYLDPTYAPEQHAFPYGTVHSVPLRNPNISEDYVYNVEVGDRLYINFGVVNDLSNLIEHDGKEYWLVDYFMALAIVREGKIKPVGEHIIIEPMEESVTHETLIIPDMSSKKILTRGIVVASNDDSIPEGATVSFEERGMFENMIEGRNLFVMYNSNILCIHE